MPAQLPVWQNHKFFVGEELKRLLAADKLMVIFYDSLEDTGWKLKSPKVFKWSIEQGISNLVISDIK
ncbi:MAG: hypothetical protein HC849_04140 [Oscillatoriales cyanobacterium RU_3_3]|nr:hypothetical protein [Microcoleus sp. SU_5_6]NJL69124.1 hypothetical protein [Microcoleus sp. SM1_3_4]NJM59560.1 hypothetical protein [Oscillatoriales cyanobacterium RU_3_3]NJR23389.1 hypothetical protein [Richelia sp. CSU_2_1]